jgi:hypothetical protein
MKKTTGAKDITQVSLSGKTTFELLHQLAALPAQRQQEPRRFQLCRELQTRFKFWNTMQHHELTTYREHLSPYLSSDEVTFKIR